jgi:hypothetical protein
MDFVLNLLLSNAVIILSVQLGKKIPALAGLIATMPLADRHTDKQFLPIAPVQQQGPTAAGMNE